MDFETKFKRNKGITLIALVVTIIVLLILAGVSINMLTGQNGILNRASEAKNKTTDAQNKEELEFALSQMAMEYHLNGGAATFSDYIFAHGDDLKAALGTSNVSLNSEAKTITYKGTLYSVATDGTVARLDGIGLSETTKTLSIVGTDKEEFTLTATLTNISGTISWSTSNANVATVTGNGATATVKAVGNGTTTIKATCNGKEATCEVTVKTISLATSLTISGETTVASGAKIDLTVAQAGGGNEEIEWSVNDKSKATVVKKDDSKATVTGVSEGAAVITATAKNSGKTATYSITVAAPKFSDYLWTDINALAKEIAKDNTITNQTVNVTKTINGKEYSAKVGDEKTITIASKDYKVRILGFNHDTLESGATAYSDSTITKAGISFEFVTSLFNSTLYKKGSTSDYFNAGGWANRELRTILNSGTETAESGKINLYDIETAMGKSGIIKSVTKSYIDQKDSSYNASKSTVETCNDKIWLLSCSEVWSDGAQYTNGSWVTTEGCYGKAGTREGSQYKYYASIEGLTYAKGNSKLVKYDTYNPSVWWWLRSPYSNGSNFFCGVYQGSSDYDYAKNYGAVAPGFAI